MNSPPPNVKIIRGHTPLLPFSPSFMHPPHVVSFNEFFKNPIKTGPHPKFFTEDRKKDEKKKDEPKTDDKNKKEDKNSADPKNKKDDDWGTKKKEDVKKEEKIKTTKLGWKNINERL